MWNHCESRLHTRKQRGQVLRSALTTVSTRAYVSLRVHVHLHRCIHTSTTPAWCNHLFTSFSFPLPISLSLFLSSTREYRHAYTHTHTQRWQAASRVSVHTGVCIHTRETAPGSRTRVKKTLVRASASSSCRTGRGRRYFFYVQRERVQGETCIRLARLKGWRRGIEGRQGEHRGYWWKGVRRGVAWVDHPLPSIFRGFFLRATALACLDERTRGGTSIIYNQTADKATIALLWMFQ